MKTKKIFAAALAGLCAVSAMGVSAFAADNETTVEAAGEKAYKITAGFVAPTMDVTVPTEIKGVINPYKIKIELDGVEAEAEGVASPKYTITNNSEDVGVKVNATYSADGLDGIVETEAAAKDPTKNTKNKKLAYVTLNTDQLADPLVMSTKETTTTDPILALTENGGAADAGEMWIGGAVPENPAEKWTANDKLTINVVLDLVPYNNGAGGNQGGGGVTAATAITALTISDDGGAGVTLPTFAAATTSYTISGCSRNDEFTFSITTANGYTAVIADDPSGNSTTTGNTVKVGNTATGTNAVTVTVTNDTDASDTATYTFTFTA